MNLSQYRLALDAIVRPLAAAVIFLVTQAAKSSTDLEVQKRVATLAVLPEIRAAREKMWAVAAQFLTDQAQQQGVTEPIYIPPLARYTDQAAATVVDSTWEQEDPEQRAATVASSLVRHAENSARQTVIRAVEDTTEESPADDYRPAEVVPTETDNAKRPVAWARQLTGADNCAFCVMLASRGPVYKSAATAGRIPASLKWVDAEGYLNAYHDHCDCLVVPIYRTQKWAGRSEADRLYRMWLEVTEGYHQGDALNALRRHLTELEREGKQISPDLREAA